MSDNKFCEWRVASGEWPVASGQWPVASRQWLTRNSLTRNSLTRNSQPSRLTLLISEVQVESDGSFDLFHFSAAEGPDMLNNSCSVYGSDLVGFNF